ncbi:unnamed protein product [Bemisia tabaci]|uniref:CID domain-containing protein n=1 Tax=Bemisia tabaci TaxID=7038 RepID=A0A9P0CAU3_BEMTA|nr:unnamed protein product [Bemisia tabaci]
MAGFSESVLSKKLDDLNASQQSIQTLSLWLIHHRKHHVSIVKTWIKEIQKADESRCLTLMYLANDVIQNSKKKGPEYGKEFGGVLKNAFEMMGQKKCSEKTMKSITRILNIWEERGVYDKRQIAEFKNALEPPEKETPQPRKKMRKSETSDDKKNSKSGRDWAKAEKEIEVEGMKELHVTLSPRTPPGDPPEPEDLIKALIDLENSASSDAVVREKIASLPPEVSEVNLLAKIEGMYGKTIS